MPDAVVVGAGIVGLCAARVLQRGGRRVEIWTRDDPAATTSAVAAAIWYPFLAEPRDRVLGWATATHAHLVGLADDPSTGVSLVAAVEVLAPGAPDPWWLAAIGGARRVAAGIEMRLPLCDTTRHLPWLVREFAAAGGVLRRRTLADLDEACAAAPIVANCTGLGARELCGDASVQPIRGQVVRIESVPLPHAWIDDTGPRPVYVLPRARDVVLGGTAQRGNARTAVDERDTAQILDACRAALPRLATAKTLGVQVGLRPGRPTVRLEVERRGDGRVLVHDYGHGGSGFTLAYGCALEVARLAGCNAD
jgi:D-amino-acid oxidase